MERVNVTNEAQSSRPSTSCTQVHIDRMQVLVREDQQIMMSAVVAYLNISYGSAHAMVHDDLGHCIKLIFDEIMEAVQAWIQRQPKSFTPRVKKLVE